MHKEIKPLQAAFTIIGALVIVPLLAYSILGTQNNPSSVGVIQQTVTTPAAQSQLAAATAPSQGLVGWWKFDEASGSTIGDASGNGIQGTFTGSPTPTWTNGKINGALALDGITGGVNFGNPSALNMGSGSFSYGLWLYATGNTSTWDEPWWKGGSSARNPGYDMELGTGSWSANISDGTAVRQVHFSSTPMLNQWVHLFVVVDRSTNQLKAYVNGSMVGSPVDLTSFGSVSGAVNATLSGGGYRFQGFVDDMRVYNRALSDTEVAAVYAYTGDAAPSPTPSPTPEPTSTPTPVPGDSTAPVISNVSVSLITTNSAVVIWTTDEPSDTQVEYGTSASYGTNTAINTTQTTSHSYTLTGLQAGTLYHFRVKSRDVSGNQAFSTDGTFTTTAPAPVPAADTTAPIISGVTVSSLTTSSAVISWTTSEPSDSQVTYGLTTAYGMSSALNATAVTSHSQTISGLQAGTLYHYKVTSKDPTGNTGTSMDATFTTVTPPNVAPTVSLSVTSPSLIAPAAITLNAQAVDSDGSISKVVFFRGKTTLATVTTAPYTFIWQNVAKGTYSLTAVATDNKGAATKSSAVSVTVSAAPTYTLSVSKTGTGSGVVTSSGTINCGTVCSSVGTGGMTTTLTATPNTGSTFTGWAVSPSANGSCGSTGTCSITLNSTTTVTAVFDLIASPTPTPTPTPSPTPSPSPVPVSLLGHTYYVALNGSDSNPGTIDRPFRTILKGMNLLRLGDILYVRGGTYTDPIGEASGLDNSTATSWDQAITVAAYPGEQVILKPTSYFGFYFASAKQKYIILDGFIMDGTDLYADIIKITYSSSRGFSHHIWVKNSTLKNGPQQGILITQGAANNGAGSNRFTGLDVYANGFKCPTNAAMTYAHCHGIYVESDNNIVENSKFHDNAGWGVHVYSGDYEIKNNIIRYNLVYNNGTNAVLGDGYGHPGIGLYSGPGHQAYGNIIWNNYMGITLNYGAANASVHDNTVYRNNFGNHWDGGPITDYGTNDVIVNNTLVNADAPAVMPAVPVAP